MKSQDKRGEAIISQVIFIVLNLVFFLSIMLFVQKTANGINFYEEIYAKKIGLLLDNSEPGMKFIIDISEIEEKLGKDKTYSNQKQEILEKLIKISGEDGTVRVAIGNSEGFVYLFFSKIRVNSYLTRDVSGAKYIIEVIE